MNFQIDLHADMCSINIDISKHSVMSRPPLLMAVSSTVNYGITDVHCHWPNVRTLRATSGPQARSLGPLVWGILRKLI